MESDVIFAGLAVIEAQGLNALEFIDSNHSFIEYKINGLTNPEVTIKDFRKSTFIPLFDELEKENSYLDDEDSNFILAFNSHAYTTLFNKRNGILLELKESNGQLPNHIVWIAVGMENSIPYFNFDYIATSKLRNGDISLLAIYDVLADSGQSDPSSVVSSHV